MTSPSVPDIRNFHDWIEDSKHFQVSSMWATLKLYRLLLDTFMTTKLSVQTMKKWRWFGLDPLCCLLWHPQISAQILRCAPALVAWSRARLHHPGKSRCVSLPLLDTCSAVSAVSAVPSSPPSSVIMMIHHNWVCLSFKSPPPHHLIT